MQKIPLLKEYLDIAFRRKWWVVVPALVGVLFSTALYFRYPKLYMATTRAQIRSQSISRALLNPIVEISSTELVTSINAEVTSEKYVQELNKRLKLVGTPGGPRDISELAKMLDKWVDLEVNTRNRYFDLKVTWDDRRLSASVANELADIYIKRNEDIRKGMADDTLDKLRRNREEKEKRLADINAKIEQFQSDHKFEIDAFRQTNIERLSGLRAEVDRLVTEMRNNEEKIREIDLDLTMPLAASPAPVARDPRLDELQRVQREIDDLKSQGKSELHPDVKQRLDRLAQLRKDLGVDTTTPVETYTPADIARRKYTAEKERLQRENAVLEEKRQARLAEAKAIEGQLERTPDRQIMLTQMQQIADRLKQEYIEARDKEQKAGTGAMVEAFGQGERIEILNPARPPKDPYWPDLRIFLFMGLAIGAGLGIGLVLLLEVFDQSFKSEEQLAASVDLPILAVIPDLTRALDRKQRPRPAERPKRATP